MDLVEILERVDRGEFQPGITTESSEGVKVSRNGLNYLIIDWWGRQEVWLLNPFRSVITQPLVYHPD
jgi:hypothetical protein